MFWLSVALALSAVLAIATGTLLSRNGSDGGYATEPVRRGDLSVTVAATGNLQPTNQVDVGSELSGLITDVFVDSNDRVRKGQILARLDTSRLADAVRQGEASLASAEAAVTQANATITEAATKLQRLEKLRDSSGGDVPAAIDLDIAQAAYVRARAALETAYASVNQAKAALSSSKTQLAKAEIRVGSPGTELEFAL